MDPSVEHINALGGKAIKAFPNQDHTAHMKAHLSFMGTQIARTNPNILAAMQKNIFEHISLMAQEQVQLEFKEEMAQIQQITQQIQQMGGMNPQMMQQNPQMMAMQQQIKQITTEMEARKAVLIAEMMEDFKNEEKKITSQFDHDPIAKLRARELDIRAIDNEQKRKEAQEKLNIDKMKAMMNQGVQEDKLDQNEELANLRADTSIEKQEMANENRLTLARMKPRPNGRN